MPPEGDPRAPAPRSPAPALPPRGGGSRKPRSGLPQRAAILPRSAALCQPRSRGRGMLRAPHAPGPVPRRGSPLPSASAPASARFPACRSGFRISSHPALSSRWSQRLAVLHSRSTVACDTPACGRFPRCSGHRSPELHHSCLPSVQLGQPGERLVECDYVRFGLRSAVIRDGRTDSVITCAPPPRFCSPGAGMVHQDTPHCPRATPKKWALPCQSAPAPSLRPDEGRPRAPVRGLEGVPWGLGAQVTRSLATSSP